MTNRRRALVTGIGVALVSIGSVAADDDVRERDRQAILSMAGTYTVTFDFRETVALTPGYDLKPPYHDTAAVELVEVIADQPGFISLQHILVLEDRVVKHWRQDWIHENQVLHEFAGDSTWKHRRVSAEDARGTWTQKVFQVDDSPRYQGIGRWTHEDGTSRWESNRVWRPLPRREYTKRDDYDVLVGRNRHTLTHTGWVHEQDNLKLVSRDGERRVLAAEIGLNRYDHVHPAKADAARGYWSRTAPFWREVRAAWDRLLVDNGAVRVHAKVANRPLWRAMFDLAERFDAANADSVRDEMFVVLETFLDSHSNSLVGSHVNTGAAP
jgi:hypothetical protein